MKKVLVTLGTVFAMTVINAPVLAQSGHATQDVASNSSKSLQISVSGDSNDRQQCMLKKRRGQALPAYCSLY
ncbi:hypothetical protein [Vibrio hippocampi]|uniref:Uncharacterized protein n=1 Tax=Vibrio hippocampi TaxID=654686 RepID=A0ABM8ZHZ6_9VIBR|nr:hypothetical protein [Vibrio hippocampi]CAH0526441.1 hypothetical protein VHP8226_01807 [Vibrio hippocampi]